MLVYLCDASLRVAVYYNACLESYFIKTRLTKYVFILYSGTEKPTRLKHTWNVSSLFFIILKMAFYGMCV